MGPFASFAISLSTICILAGGLTSFHVGFCTVGGAAIGLGWPLCCLFSLAVALTMAQVASAFPWAGGPYQWAAILGGRGWGWVTALFGLAGLITMLAAINLGACRFVVGASLGRTDDPGQVYPRIQTAAVVLVTLSQALINHRGIRLTSWLIDVSGYLILTVAAVLTTVMLIFGLCDHSFDLGRLTAFDNFSGPRGGNVWPEMTSIPWLFALGLLLPAYTITGFDAAAQTAEETIDPRRNVPRAIVRAVLISGVAGWIMLSAIVLAIPDMEAVAAQGEQCFLAILRTVVTLEPLRPILYVGVAAAMYLCGLATLTAASRMAYGFARDGGLPFSRALSRLGAHDSPSVAIWTVAGLTLLFAVTISYEGTSAVCAIFLYIAYLLPTILGLLTYRRWSHLAVWQVGWWYRPLAGVGVLGCVVLVLIGMHPPNEVVAWVVGGLLVALLALWFGYKRRHFRGPPQEVLDQLRPAEARTVTPARP